MLQIIYISYKLYKKTHQKGYVSMSIRQKGLARAGMIAVCVAALGSTTAYVHAEPSSAELERKTSGLQSELDSLHNQLDVLLTEMDSIAEEAETIAASMNDTEARLEEAQAKGEKQYEDMKLRIKYMYEAGDTSFIELLSSAEGMTDFLNKADFIQTVSEYDRKMLEELLATQDEIVEEGAQLEKQKQALTAKQEELGKKRAEVERMISSTSSDLGKYNAQLERAKAAEALAAKQAAEEQAARERAAAEKKARKETDKKKEVKEDAPEQTETPDSEEEDNASTEDANYLGSFKITHYCPCYYCCGKWAGGNTASGTKPTSGRTIAVDPKVIPLGSKVVIHGHTYIAEDTGKAIKGKKIDIFVDKHSTALAYGTYYTDVYLAE